MTTLGEVDWTMLADTLRVGRETLVRAGAAKPTSSLETRQATEGPVPLAFYDCRRIDA